MLVACLDRPLSCDDVRAIAGVDLESRVNEWFLPDLRHNAPIASGRPNLALSTRRLWGRLSSPNPPKRILRSPTFSYTISRLTGFALREQMDIALERLQMLLAIIGVTLIVALPVGLYLIAGRMFDEEWALERNWNVNPTEGAKLLESIEDKGGFHGDGVGVYIYEATDSPQWIIPNQVGEVDEGALLAAVSITEQLNEARDISDMPELTACRWISVQRDRGELIECRSADSDQFVLVERLI